MGIWAVMNPLDVAQQYFDAWNAHDPQAVLATMASDGTYLDPTTKGPLSGQAFAGYMGGLFAAFPDVTFEVKSKGLAASDLVAAQWVMRGTNTGSNFGLPPSGKAIELQGADFIRVDGGKIRSVEGYFDAGEVPRQLGMQVLVQPKEIGPYTFGNAVRTASPNKSKPGAFSITALRARSPEDVAGVSEMSRKMTQEMLGMKGFLGLVGVTVGERMLTISAWESPDDPRQMMQPGGLHAAAMQKFFGTELAAGGYTSVWSPVRINTVWVRCETCNKMLDSAKQTCGCGAALPEPLAWW